MTLEELVVKDRSYRRFRATPAVTRAHLTAWVDLARRGPSAGNRQPLKYVLVDGAANCARLFPHLRWAGLLKDWGGPKDDERPTAYLILLGDQQIARNPALDAGIAAQTILLAATEAGFGGCMLGAIDRPKIAAEFAIPERYEIVLVLALGAPGETCLLEEAAPGGSIAYYRDTQSVHHVPKRPLNEIIVDFGNAPRT